MNQNILNIFKAQKTYRLLLLLGFFCYPSNETFAQKQQLVPSTKVVKIAFVDHKKLRKEFKAFYSAKEKMSKENKAYDLTYERELQLLDKQSKEQFRLDSVNGGNGRKKIIDEMTAKRLVLQNKHGADQKKRNDDRLAIMQEYGRKIILAVEGVVSEGGFTDVKPFTKEAANQRGVNITDLILKKLN